MSAALRTVIASAAIGFSSAAGFAQSSSQSCDAHHAASVDSRGDHVMGFDHERTAHHFRLTETGGAIEVGVNDPGDTASRDAIRTHLTHIAALFSEGNFEAPMLIHDRVPPGVPILKKRKRLVRWIYEDTESGGRISIATEDARARAAVHEFLRFQIEDHRTGDSPKIGK